MNLTVDHVPFAWHDLDEVAAEFERLGLSADYGGVHDNGITHMSVLGFDDGSYLELIAERPAADADASHDFWQGHVRADAGPAAWSHRVPDVTAECVRVLRAGTRVRGPLYGARERDDGTLVEWDRAEFGPEADRLLLPFAIADRTPPSYRVTPSDSVADGPLTGVGQVVLGTREPERIERLLTQLYDLPTPRSESVSGLGRVASFPGQPVALATPEGTPWLDDRLDEFRHGPCAVLLATDDLDAAREAVPLGETVAWPDGRAAFVDGDLLGRRLGVVERS